MTRVLLIDDQNDVRAVTCTVLKVNRFDAGEAASSWTESLRGWPLRRRDCRYPAAGRDGLQRHSDLARRRSGLQTAKLSYVVCLSRPFRPRELISAIGSASATPNARRASTGALDRVTV
jgi:FixJ family two-component response regulator